jgi:hypothetical protein
MEAGLSYIRKALHIPAGRAVGTAVAFLWVGLAERAEGRTIVSLNPDGSVNKQIL